MGTTSGQLNSPWELAQAPASFGRFGGDLLVGDFGDGPINAYRQQPAGNYEDAGELTGGDHKSLTIDGLWSLLFGHGALAKSGPTDTLFFTAGPEGETTASSEPSEPTNTHASKPAPHRRRLAPTGGAMFLTV